MRRTSLLAKGVLLGTLLLTGCGTASPSAAPDAPAPTPTKADDAPQNPAATSQPALPAVLPTDCTSVVDAATYDATFGSTPLNDPALQYPEALGALSPAVPPASATNDEIIEAATVLRCIWRHVDADISFLFLEAARVPSEVAQQRLDALATEGYTCTDVLDGRQCQLVGTSAQYPVEEADTQFVRDGVLIRIQQANVPTNGLMDAVVGRVWS